MRGNRPNQPIILCTLALVAAVLIILRAASASATIPTRACAVASAGHAQCDLRVTVKRHVGTGIRRANAATPTNAPAVGDPAYLQEAYDLTALSASRGHGDTIAIVDAFNDAAAASDLSVYRAHYNLPACTTQNGCLQIDNEHGQTSPLPTASSAWAIEITADLEAVSAICPNCNIDLVEANSDSASDLDAAMRAAAQLGANQISDSWSVVDASSPFGSSVAQMLGTTHTPAVIAATGDTGAVARGENAYPAALSDVTAVGGTTLTPSSSPRGVSETAWSNAGYGCDTAEAALAYQSAGSCQGRAYADVSADADPHTGLDMYEAAEGGWVMAGGTSLATPIVAAYEALTGVDGTSNRWAYLDASELNKVAGGYGGATGTGTISGDVVTGAPGVSPVSAASVTATSVSLTSGIYSNGATTTYGWQYGTSTAYGSSSTNATLSAAAGATQVTTTITGLAPNTTYHFRLAALNAHGAAAGYDYTVTTS